MDEETYRLMMVASLKENVQNTVREYYEAERRYVEILRANTPAPDAVDDILDVNKIPEYQLAIRQVRETVAETDAFLDHSHRLMLRIRRSANSLARLGLSNSS